MKTFTAVFMFFGLFGIIAKMDLSFSTDHERAKLLVKKAMAYANYQGKAKAVSEINRHNGLFDKENSYVFAYDLKGIMVAHPKNRALIGKNMIDIPDTEGKLFHKEIVALAKSKGSGWVDYVYLNPESNELEHKTTYIQKSGDLIFCCGIYMDYSRYGNCTNKEIFGQKYTSLNEY